MFWFSFDADWMEGTGKQFNLTFLKLIYWKFNKATPVLQVLNFKVANNWY